MLNNLSTNSPYLKELLKGGSLAGTYLYQEDIHSSKVVRKEICLKDNREYGYQRWYSQMKRLQRYDVLFPGLFPSFIGCGLYKDSQTAFFDIEFLETAINCYDYLSATKSPKKVEHVLKNIIVEMNKVHSIKMKSSITSIDVYIEEEIYKKLRDCLVDDEFRRFYEFETIQINGNTVRSLSSSLEEYIAQGRKIYKNPEECYTHGNITLENMMYSEEEDRIYFIDPYEENIIDNSYNEYSQILQSSNSHYEIYNDSVPRREYNVVSSDITIPFGISYFNDKFTEYLDEVLSPEEKEVVTFFEISQFIRMLPFKMHTEKEKMFFFYGIASEAIDNFLKKNSA